jgi:hypothetical protein
MTKIAHWSAGQNRAKYPKGAGLRGLLTRMTHDQPTAPRPWKSARHALAVRAGLWDQRPQADRTGRAQRLTARASTARTPAGVQIKGLMSKASRCSPRSATRAENEAIALVIAFRSQGGWPRTPLRASEKRKPSSSAGCLAAPSAATRAVAGYGPAGPLREGEQFQVAGTHWVNRDMMW